VTLNDKEKDDILERLRNEYIEYGNDFGRSFFSIEEFDKRYTHALVNRMNLEAFLLSEISFLEELKDKFEAHYNEEKDSMDNKMEEIAKRQQDKWQQFEKIDFHPAAEMETRYFYGAVVEFCQIYLSTIENFFKGTEDMFSLDRSIRDIEKLGYQSQGIFSSRMLLHHQILTADRQKAEKDKQHLMKDCAIALFAFSKKLEEIIIGYPDKFLEQDFNLKRESLFLDKKKELFAGQSNLQVLQRIIGFALNIIESFRLRTFINQVP